MVKVAAVLTLGVMVTSCTLFIPPDEELSLECRPYSTHELKTDGFYYEGEIAQEETIEVYFFYQNGTLRSLGSYSGKDFYDRVSADSSPDSTRISNRFKSDWGTFHINGKKLVFEKWEPASGPYFVVYRRTGEILNDTTFSIDNLQDSEGPLTKFKRKIFHFKQFENKPDSTNEFIRCP